MQKPVTATLPLQRGCFRNRLDGLADLLHRGGKVERLHRGVRGIALADRDDLAVIEVGCGGDEAFLGPALQRGLDLIVEPHHS
jgi:hypothetical protein